MKKKFTVEQEVHIPLTPNFFLVGPDKTPRPLGDFTETEIRTIGNLMTLDMVAKAKRK
jgi:hypothetical protein